jgi:hypothetical protein
VAALPLARAESEELLRAGWRLSAVALLALVIAIVLGWTQFLTASLGLLGGFYGLQLAVDDTPLDLAAPIVAVGLIVTAELGYWSLEERERVEGEAGDSLRRLAFLSVLGLATFVLVAALLALVDAVRTRGLAVDLLGAAAAVATVVTVVVIARRQTA